MVVKDGSNEFVGLTVKQVLALKAKSRQRKHRKEQHRMALNLWALVNVPRMSTSSKSVLMPADWNIHSKDKDNSATVEKLRRFNQHTGQHWRFSPITGRLEIIK